MFPKKNLAIIIDTVEGLEIKAYLRAVATKTSPTNIIAASKISQNRFCCYFNDEKIVDQLTKEGNNIVEIDNHKLKMRPYVMKSKRVIFSNVHPSIPHDEIITVIKAQGITPKSNMSLIKLGFAKTGFTHILSFRRQIYIDPNYDDGIHYIYIFTDKITCFICNQEGHTARYCTNDKDTHAHGLNSLTVNNTQIQINSATVGATQEVVENSTNAADKTNIATDNTISTTEENT